MKSLLAGAVLGLSLATAVLAAATGIDPAKSKLTATFTQMNAPVEGTFKTFSGTIAYDPANAAASNAEITVDAGSYDVGDDDYNAEIRKKEWFDAATYKTATFKSTAIKPLGPDRFEAEGTLSLKGKSVPVKTTVSVKTAGGTRTYSGELPVSRTAFAMGDPQWNDVLADAVTVKFAIVAPAS